MRDLMMEINQALRENALIATSCGDRIKFYEYAETGDLLSPFIIITPSQPSKPSSYGSNTNHSESYYYQINVEATKRGVRDSLAYEVRKVMRTLGFEQQAGGLDTYFKETKRYVNTRLYSAILFTQKEEENE